MLRNFFRGLVLMVGIAGLLLASHRLPASLSLANDKRLTYQLERLPEDEGLILRLEDGKLTCQAAAAGDVLTTSGLSPQANFEPRQNLTVHGTGNITFTLRFGTGFDASPQARDAFLKGAEIWASTVEAPQPVTIIIDVDYTPTVAGSTIPLGRALPQSLIGRGEYKDWRASVIANANSGKDLALFSALPEGAVPTDLGDTDAFVMPSALLRVVGLIPPIADPDAEQAVFGLPPSITVLNSAPWDFNPDDGIGAGQLDFIGTALHEIGHVIGFFTRVGSTETNPNLPLTVSAYDIYRFRPGMTMETFTTAKRILTAGGQHVHYAGENEIPMSTARINLTGGDGFGADHWKNSSFVGVRLGVMTPQQQFGERFGVFENDLIALKAMGFRLVGEARNPAPYAASLKSDLQGDGLTLTGKVYDLDADVVSAQISLLDGLGNTLREDEPIAAGSGERVSSFAFSLSDLLAFPAALRARLVFRDQAGNSSAPTEVGIGQADAGGATISSAVLKGKKLVIKGSGLAGQLALEINGAVAATKTNASNGKAKFNINGVVLRPGANRLRLLRNGARSNVLVLIDGTTEAENKVEFITSPRLKADHNRAYQYDFAAKSLSGRPVQYEVQVPSWMAIDLTTNRISGLAGWENLDKSFEVIVRASDGIAQAEQKFTLQIKLGEILCESEVGDPAQSPYILPFEVGKRFQCNQSYCPPNPQWGHHNWFALDFEMPIGTKIIAARSGQVAFVEERFTDGNRQPGQENHIFILHDDGTVAQYTHLTKNGALVEVGDRVVQGQVIGRSGDTGASSGPHLHFVTYRGSTNFSRHYSTPVNFKNAEGPLNAQHGLIFLEWYEAKPF